MERRNRRSVAPCRGHHLMNRFDRPSQDDREDARFRRASSRASSRVSWLAPWSAILVAILIFAPIAVSQAEPVCERPEDLAAIEAARERIADHGSKVWPGWNEAPAVLLRSGDVDCLIGHPEPPAGFEPVSDGIYQRAGHLLPVPAATAFPVADAWAVAVPSQRELQAFVDEHLGVGVVNLDAALFERTITHEGFHAFQMTTFGGPGGIPEFGSSTGADLSLGDVERIDGIDEALRDQGRLLADAVTADTNGDVAEAVAEFLALRSTFRATAPAGTEALERQLEFLEGTSRYADVLLSLHPPTRPDAPGVDAWQDLLTQLNDLPAVESGIRDRYAALGAAQAFALDRLYPGWKQQAIPGGASLETLLHEAVAGRASVPDRLASLPMTTARLDGHTWRLLIAADENAWTNGLQGVPMLGGVDGLLFVFPDDVRAPFWMRGAVVPLDIAFFDRDGAWLASHHMPLCEQDPCPTYRPDEAYRYALEAMPGRGLAGVLNGALLELEGW